MTQKEELLSVKAQLENRLKDTDLSAAQKEVIQAGLDGVNDELAQLSSNGSAAAAPEPKPATPPSVKSEKKGTKKEKPAKDKPAKKEMNADEKAAFAAKMKAAKEAKQGKKEPVSTPTPAHKDSSKGTFIGIGRIGCDFDVYLNDSGKTIQVPNINGPMETKNGDYVMYLRDGDHSFTTIKKSMFSKRCVIVEPAPQAKPANPAIPQAAKEQKPKDEQPKEHAHTIVKDVVKQMEKQGCDIHEFLKETEGTPLDAWIQGKVIEFTSGKTDEWIDRVYIDTEHGDFYVRIIYKSATGWFAKPKYVKVCPERGIETTVSADHVEGKKYRVQYGKDKLRAMYHYPEDVTGCRSLAKEIYQIRKDKGDSSGKYQKYVNNCRNPEWTKKYKGFISWMHQSAMAIRKDRPSMSHGEALAQVAKEMRIAAKK